MISAAAGIGSMLVVFGLGMVGAAACERFCRTGAHARVCSDEEERESDEDSSHGFRRASGKFLASRDLHAALQGATTSLAIAGRNWRGLGFRVVGLRRVDARTGGPVSVRSVLVGQLFDQGWQAVTSALFGARVQRGQLRMSALEPQVRALRRKYAGDPQAQLQAVAEFYEANNVKPFAGCGWRLAGLFISRSLLALGSREGRTLRERITGTCVIVDR